MLGRSVREVLGMQQAVPRTGAQRLYIMAQVFIHTVENKAVLISNLNYRRLGTGVTCLPDGAVLKCSSAQVLKCSSAQVLKCSPILRLLQPHVPTVLGVEAGQEEVALCVHKRRGFLFGGSARTGRVGVQWGAEAHPHGVGGPVGGWGSWGCQAASSNQHQLVAGTLPTH